MVVHPIERANANLASTRGAGTERTTRAPRLVIMSRSSGSCQSSFQITIWGPDLLRRLLVSLVRHLLAVPAVQEDSHLEECWPLRYI